jgi:predicted enzyme related to lactoylglutathione lyase
MAGLTCKKIALFYPTKIANSTILVNHQAMQVIKVKYVLWAADWQRCLKFYDELFGGVVSFEGEVWSEIVIAGATLGIHGGGEGKRTWTGLSFQLDDLREGITRLIECGGSLTSEPNDTPEDPLHLAMCVDPEGNEFMMTQSRR